MLGFGVLGYLMRVHGFSVVPFIIAFFLASRFELSLIQFLVVSGGDITFLIGRPVAAALLISAVVAVWYFAFRGPKVRNL